MGLDRIIAEQAAYYGMTIEEYGRMTENFAKICEDYSEFEELFDNEKT